MANTLITTKEVFDLIKSQIKDQPRLQSRDEPFNAYPYVAQRHNHLWDLGFNREDLLAMLEWGAATFQRGDWNYSCGNFYFRNENDRIMFMLRWS